MTVRPFLLVAGVLALLPVAAVAASATATATVPAPAPAPAPAFAFAFAAAAAQAQVPVAAAAKARVAVTAPRVSDAWIAESPPGARHNAAYLSLRNGSSADTLLAVESPVAEVAELHVTEQVRGLQRMRPESHLALAPGARVHMAPGERHIMLVNMKRTLAVGEKVPLTLRFRKAGTLTVLAEVRALPVDAAPAPHDHAHHPH